MHEERSPLRASRVGERLRAAREEIDMPLEEIAARTRVPIRHLVAIEEGDFASLPAAPYSAGFVRAYAGALGAGALGTDAADLGRAFRAEIDRAGDKIERPELRPFQPADPSRLPPRALAFVAAAIALLLVIGTGIWRSGTLRGEGPEARARLAAAGVPSPTPTAGPATGRTGAPSVDAVVLTALRPVWLRVYERSGATLFTGELAQGRQLAVPASAADPLIRLAQPEALRVTVGGRAVAPLGAPAHVVSDVSLAPAALLAAPAAPPAAFVPLPSSAGRARGHGRRHRRRRDDAGADAAAPAADIPAVGGPARPGA